MSNTDFYCLPTIIGSMPHTDPDKACDEVARHLKDIPAWPQLPALSFLENMYVQYSEGFPGIVVLPEEQRIYVDSSKDIQKPLEELYAAYLDDDIDRFPMSREYAAGLYAFLEHVTAALNERKSRPSRCGDVGKESKAHPQETS